MKEPVRIGVLGAGWIAEQIYLPALLGRQDVKIVACYDVCQENLSRFAQAAHVADSALSLDACLAPHVDAILLCTPANEHADQIAAAIAVGKYVLCEKPVVRTTSDFRLLAAPSSIRTHLMGSATMRLREDVSLLLEWVKSGALGRLTQVRLGWWRETGVPAPGSWRTDANLSALGVVEDLAPHLLDIIASLVSGGIWREVSATQAHLTCRYGDQPTRAASWFKHAPESAYNVPDQAMIHLMSDTGCSIEVEVQWAGDIPKDYCLLSFEGSNGSATLEGLLGLSTARRFSRQRCTLRSTGAATLIRDFPVGPMLQIAAFERSIAMFLKVCRGADAPVANAQEIGLVAGWLSQIDGLSAMQRSLPTTVQQA